MIRDINIDDIEAKARTAKEQSPLAAETWHATGRTVWSGDWRTDGEQVCTYLVDGDPRAMQAPPAGTEAIMQHIAASSPDVVLALVARVRELEERVESAEASAGANTMKAGQFDRIRADLDTAGVPRTNPNATPGYESMTTEQRVVWLISRTKSLEARVSELEVLGPSVVQGRQGSDSTG